MPAGQRGRAMGTIYTALELAIALGSILAGVAVDAVGFTATFVAASAVALTTAAAALTRVRRPT